VSPVRDEQLVPWYMPLQLMEMIVDRARKDRRPAVALATEWLLVGLDQRAAEHTTAPTGHSAARISQRRRP
jgi:hypothetical protein